MPVTITRNGLDFLIRLKQKVESPELIKRLGDAMADSLVVGFGQSGLRKSSGATLDSLSKVGVPQKTSTGWRIGVGDGRRLGEPGESAPRGTLKEFFKDYPEAMAPQWKYIPKEFKEKLAEMRRAGRYGGKGPDYANYAWAQERGNSRAFIRPRGFIETGVGIWESRAREIVESYFAQGT